MRRKRTSLLLVLGMLTALLPLGAAAPASAATTDLLLSEYVEGSSFNKAVEIYNGTGGAVDLGAGSYTVELYSNGSPTPSQTVALSGTVADGDVFVLSHGSASAAIQAQTDLTSSAVMNFNGDDSVVLRKGGAIVDAFGQNATDPGSQWPGGGQNDTLQRMSSICAGDTNFADAFDASVEWNVLAQDDTTGLGSHTADCGPLPDVAPTVSSVSPADGAAGVALDADITVTFSEPVTATDPWVTISCATSGAITATVTGGPSSYTLDPDSDFVNDELCDVTVLAAQVVDQDGDVDNMDADFESSFATAPSVAAITLIHDVQGSGASSPLVGLTVTIEGIVVGDFQDDVGANGDLNGFHVQEEDSDTDADPATSEGIFIFNGSDPAVDVAIGDLVRVEGPVSEFNGLTQITSFSGVAVVSSGNPSPTPATVTLPFTSGTDLEAYEGMSVLLPQALVISEYFNFDRFGEIVLTVDRAAQPTAVFAPGSTDAANLADLNARSRITLDDGRGGSNADPALHPNGSIFDLSNRFRGGDTVQNLPGVVDYSFGSYKVQPTTGGEYTAVNPRSASPDAVGGNLTVATFNVLNYFTTLDYPSSDPRDNTCGPLANQGCRGADSNQPDEFMRQRDKIIDAITTIDADVVGLMEIENDAADVAVDDLVAGLNDATGAGTYASIVTGPVGQDVIRVALIYKPASVTPYGAHTVLEGDFLDPNNTGSPKNRAALAQSFLDNANGGVFTVAVNHLKSKGSGCGVGDDDPEQGSCNLTRTLSAQILADWLQTDPTGSGDSDYLIIGDLNSYDLEDPISALKARGYTDLILRDIGPDAYSYVFSGQWGYLDYIMANAAVASQVTGTTVWHINSDEPDILDYDTSFKQDAQDALYEPNAFRSSDHDPVIAGLDVTVTPMQAKEHSLTVLADLLPTGNNRDDNRINKAIKNIGDSLNPAYWVDDFHLSDKGRKVFNKEKTAVKDLMKVRTVDVDGVIDALVDADEILAGTAIADAIARGGDADNIARAQHEMEEAAEDVAIGRPDHAIDHYRKAWQWAQKALDEAPPRFATFNASLNRSNAGDLIDDLSDPNNAQAQTIAEIIQRNRPDVLLVNEFDYDAGGVAAGLFQDNYLSIGQNGADPIVYPYRYAAPSNTGVYSGFDLDNSGVAGDFVPNDSFGFGFFEGQFAFVVYSMHPINYNKIRTFQNFLWKDMPGALLPDDPATTDPADWYSPEELDVFRLSSKNHVDVPIKIHGETIHFLVSHPTPPVFDGPEDRNGTRNFDEIRFWADYATGGKTARYIYDDNGKKGGLGNNARFVIAGDLNSDPLDGDSIPGAAQQLLEHPRVNVSQTPSSLGGTQQAALQGGINAAHLSDPAFDTADFSDSAPGNLRADYVLPSSNLGIVDSAVFWPEMADPLFPLVGTFPFPSSDHRLVWVDVDVHGPDHDDDDQQPT